MKIGELAERLGVEASTIRFYEARGLISAQRRANGYREYSEDTILLLTIIISARQVGFSLDEITHLLPSGMSGWDHEKLISVIGQKVADIEQMEQQLRKNKMRLKDVIKAIVDKPADMDCGKNARALLKRFED